MIDSSFRVHLFGSARIACGSRPVQNFPTEKGKLLFCYLTLFHQAEHPRSVLQGVFWGDRPEARARHSLSTELWRLRRWLTSLALPAAPELVIHDSHIRFRFDESCWVDTFEFEQAVQRANRIRSTSPERAAAALRQAVDLYDGELLRGCYYDWCLVSRESLRQMFLEALWSLMLYSGERGEHAQAIQYGRRILQEEPLREEVHRELIRRLAADRQPAQALAQYQACEAVLRRELQIEPDAETRQLFRSLLDDQGPIRAGRPSSGASTRQIRRLAQRVQAALRQVDAVRADLVETLHTLEELDRDQESGMR